MATPCTFASIEKFTCNVNRGSLDSPLFLLNHWVEDPFPPAEASAEANAYDVLYGRANACAATFGHAPNIAAVDWCSEGDLFAVVDALNGLWTAMLARDLPATTGGLRPSSFPSCYGGTIPLTSHRS